MTARVNLSDLMTARPSDEDVRFALDVRARQAAAPTEAEVQLAHEIFARIGAQTVEGREPRSTTDTQWRQGDGSAPSSKQVTLCGRLTVSGKPCRMRRADGVKPCQTHGTPDEWEAYRQTDHYKREIAERESAARQRGHVRAQGSSRGPGAAPAPAIADFSSW